MTSHWNRVAEKALVDRHLFLLDETQWRAFQKLLGRPAVNSRP